MDSPHKRPVMRVWCYLCCCPKRPVEQTVELPTIWVQWRSYGVTVYNGYPNTDYWSQEQIHISMGIRSERNEGHSWLVKRDTYWYWPPMSCQTGTKPSSGRILTRLCLYTSGVPRILLHDDVIKCKHFPRNWPFVREIHRSPVNFPHKGQWRGALMFSLTWINDWVNNREAGDLRRQHGHYDVIVMAHTL